MPIDLDELERLERETTPGPWKIDDPDGDHDWMNTVPESARYDFRRYYKIEMRRTDSPTGRFYMSVPTSFDDAYFIAATHNALPDLLTELRTLRARVAEMERALDVCRVELERFRRDNEMACENTPWPGCECPGCETARERAEAELKGGSDG